MSERERQMAEAPANGDGASVADVQIGHGVSCDDDGHCVTCSDEALVARVLRVDEDRGIALVSVQDLTQEIDITLVDGVRREHLLLVHAGVAIATLDE
ncbi:MAG TPA: HypC/HybG/HupF family hydrogenase formation chaperone [Herpetosiphonaceae bacterium]|nr:HypC/HybG/HupF family hydrogenase formation chaperone [Herpetosiphonaceae bacterium]